MLFKYINAIKKITQTLMNMMIFIQNVPFIERKS